ncbi:prp 4 c [Fusarium longipes]|uniref:Prp 4 c n=1 Tax=Fusarium longipes TaxID=694270 RepID=A0A395RJB4_9HYPO|nr:prp 4 c [Fusarium longipes]
MLFQTFASIALLACATNAASQAQPQPYKLIKAPVAGLSFARRSTPGYQPDQSVCSGGGNTCADACGSGFESCPSEDGQTHCFNPIVKQSCCFDGTGNSCDKGFYCSHDTKAQTWCCPDSMGLAECAAAYGVEDGLKTDKLLTTTATTAAETTTAEPTTTTEPTTTAVPTTSELETTSTTVYITSTSQASTSTKAASTTVAHTTESAVVKTTTKADETTIVAPSSGYSTAWSGSNSTIATAAPTQPSESAPGAAEPSSISSGASLTGVSAMLIAAAGAFALL